jgi:opacity protein-like surface antigen
MRVVCLIVTLLVPAAAGAQSVAEPQTWTVTPFVGVSLGTGTGRTSSLGLGAAVGYDITANLGVEAELGRTFDVAGDTDFVDWSLTNLHANAVYHFDVVRVTPYATAGLGFERSSLKVDDTQPTIALSLVPSSTEVAFNFGGGVKYKVGDTMLARVDLRRFQANDFAPDHWRVYGGLTLVFKRANP